MEEREGITDSKGITDSICKESKEFFALYVTAQQDMNKKRRGKYQIEIARILAVSCDLGEWQPPFVLVRDTQGAFWVIGESKILVSRWSVREGDKFVIRLKNLYNTRTDRVAYVEKIVRLTHPELMTA